MLQATQPNTTQPDMTQPDTTQPDTNRSLFPPLNSNETLHVIQIVSTAWAWATMWLAQPTPHYSLSSQKSEGRLFWWVSPLIEATTLNPSCIKEHLFVVIKNACSHGNHY